MSYFMGGDHLLKKLSKLFFFVDGGPINIGTWFLWVIDIWKKRRNTINKTSTPRYGNRGKLVLI